MASPQLTFAIPYYRGLDLLEKAIQSVFSQTQSDWKLLISNDGGPDPALDALVARFADSRVTLVHNERNMGMAGNWNACLDRADTPLVTLLHADDELLPNYTAVVMQAVADHPDATLYYCQASVVDENGQPSFSLPDRVKRFIQPQPVGPYTQLTGEAALTRLLRGNFIFCPTICYQKSRLGELRFSSDWRFVLDFDLTTHLLLKEHTFIGINEVAYAYRRHGSNATVEYTQNRLRFEEEIQLFNQLADECARKGWQQARRVAQAKTIIRLNLLYCALTDSLKGHLPNAVQKLRLLTT
ncbi:glycosyltransferase [Spirosoma taeanense]|uniref:Glycosyltransferase n=1 Tax=Spirosoma taeanense TaxID=2735870 RepID=A0A6M5YEG4_9BACT|nr:glycosyltransferase [Spirosoma taeanense]QJW91711.1 glycosyltransferase [Spirosoma taeanense]